MKLMITSLLVLIFASFMAAAKDAAKTKKKIIPITTATTTTAPTATTATADAKKDGAPCETKEDIVEKLEAEKKAKEAGEKPKGFSLQGGNTGCSVK